MKNIQFKIVAVFLIFLSTISFGQNTVGINTLTPNKNSVLDLISPNRNQGFLVPRLTTSERIANSFTANLSNTDNGLLVYDSDINQFFFWSTNTWIPIGQSQTYRAGAGISISGNTIANTGDNDNDSYNEIQSISLSGNTLSISGSNTINITSNSPTPGSVLKWGGSSWQPSADLGTNYTAGTGINITGTSITNSLPDQVVQLTGAGATLISGTYPNFTITSTDLNNVYTAGAGLWINGNTFNAIDASSTNEIQNLSFTGNAVGVSGGTGFNLSANPPTSDQVLKWNSSLTRWEAGADLNTTYLAGAGVWISGSTIGALDASSTNEFQSLTLIGNTLGISNGTGVNLSPVTPTGDQVLKWNSSLSRWQAGVDQNTTYTQGAGVWISGSTIGAFDVSSTNEIQTLTMTGNSMGISGGNSIGISATAPTSDHVLKWNGLTSRWEAAVDMNTSYSAGTGINIQAGNIINSLWTSSGSDIMPANSMSNVGIGAPPTVGFRLYVNGKVKSNGINELSDKRLKKDIIGINSCLEKVLKLNGVSYYWDKKNFPEMNFSDTRQIGLIAQDVKVFFPEVVDEDKEGFLSVQYSHLVPVLINAIKEQQLLIDDLKNQVFNLETQNTEFKKEVEKISSIQLQIDELKVLLEKSGKSFQAASH